MHQHNPYKTLVLLLVIALGLGAGTLQLYRSKYVNEYSVLDPDSGQTILLNSASNRQRPDLMLLGNQKLLDMGMSYTQYSTMLTTLTNTITDTYQKQYKSAAINSNSITYDAKTSTFTFRVRVGEIGSGKYLAAKVRMLGKFGLGVTITDANGKILKDSAVPTS